MNWTRIGAIVAILLDEIAFTVFFFGVLPAFDVYLPLTLYIGVMVILVAKDIIAIKFIWNIIVKQPEVGREALIGKIGIAYTDIDLFGLIRIDNELWKAEASYPIKKGEKTRITDMDGLSLQVESVSTDED
ncbi:MAG: NfeD family protein [Theionarchaea archaeon]|nr:NfeD family protein [Theionarchaea archaeon]